MNKRKKASASTSRSTRGEQLSGPPGSPPKARKKSKGGKATSPASDKAASQNQLASSTLALAAECTVSDALLLKERLASLLGEPQAVTLDITALQRIDTAAMQVISAFVRE